MRTHALLFCLLAGVGLLLVSARRQRAPRGPVPTIGDAMEIRTDPDYLGRDWQAVLTMAPLSANRRIMPRSGNLTGVQRRRGLVTWMKKRDNWPWENPWEQETLSESPFKLRFLRHDPAGIALSMAQEGKIVLRDGGDARRPSVQVSLAKPKPWYRKFF